jgi:hypothetical protein
MCFRVCMHGLYPVVQVHACCGDAAFSCPVCGIDHGRLAARRRHHRGPSLPRLTLQSPLGPPEQWGDVAPTPVLSAPSSSRAFAAFGFEPPAMAGIERRATVRVARLLNSAELGQAGAGTAPGVAGAAGESGGPKPALARLRGRLREVCASSALRNIVVVLVLLDLFAISLVSVGAASRGNQLRSHVGDHPQSERCGVSWGRRP